MRHPTPGTCPIPWFSPEHGPLPCGQALAPGEHVCPSCARDFAGRLRGDVRDAIEALAVTISRGDRFRRDIVRRALDDDHQPGDRPELGAHGTLPVNLDAAARRDDLTAEIARWTRVAYSRAWPGIPFVLPAQPPTDTVGAAAWLADHLDDLRREPWLPTMIVRVDRRTRKALAVCDRPDDRVRVTCPRCGNDVPLSTDPAEVIACRGWVATPDGSRVRCDQWGVQSWWVEECAPTREPCRAQLLPLRLEAYGYRVEPATVRKWVSLGKLKPVGADDRGRPTYDVAHACAIAGASAARRRAVRAT